MGTESSIPKNEDCGLIQGFADYIYKGLKNGNERIRFKIKRIKKLKCEALDITILNLERSDKVNFWIFVPLQEDWFTALLNARSRANRLFGYTVLR